MDDTCSKQSFIFFGQQDFIVLLVCMVELREDLGKIGLKLTISSGMDFTGNQGYSIQVADRTATTV